MQVFTLTFQGQNGVEQRVFQTREERFETLLEVVEQGGRVQEIGEGVLVRQRRRTVGFGRVLEEGV